ncbi:hypothetical protein O0544_02045 [Edwardsiella anguillarum]|nr:hypothetical protein [Edwardsiella anguillarum]
MSSAERRATLLLAMGLWALEAGGLLLLKPYRETLSDALDPLSIGQLQVLLPYGAAPQALPPASLCQRAGARQRLAESGAGSCAARLPTLRAPVPGAAPRIAHPHTAKASEVAMNNPLHLPFTTLPGALPGHGYLTAQRLQEREEAQCAIAASLRQAEDHAGAIRAAADDLLAQAKTQAQQVREQALREGSVWPGKSRRRPSPPPYSGCATSRIWSSIWPISSRSAGVS